MSRKIAIIWCAFFLGVCALEVRARQSDSSPPQFAKGDLSDIKGKRRVYVNAGSPRRDENVIKELKKYNGIEIVGDVAVADYVVAYRVERVKTGVAIGSGGIPTQDDSVFFGRMFVYVPGKDSPGRLVWESRLRYQVAPPPDVPPTPGWRRGWEQPLEKSAASKFIKALKKASGEK